MPSAFERLDKRVAREWALTRSEARDAVRDGRVAVEGAPCRDPGARTATTARVTLDDDAPADVVVDVAVFHKPEGVQCTVGDPLGRPSLAESAIELLRRGLHPVGRLDADTSGLLPFVADGALTQRLLHPRHGVEKVYVADVEGRPGPELGARLAAGVETAEGVHVARLIAVDGATVTLAVAEGKHRMVRRMLNNVGFPVLTLRRVAFGAFTLGDLPEGSWRPATDDEARWAASLVTPG
jgi:pseudouridine synthase